MKIIFFHGVNPLIFALPSKKGSLAQLVQSICLTSRGSAVRTRQLPHNTKKVSKNEAFFCLMTFAYNLHTNGFLATCVMNFFVTAKKIFKQNHTLFFTVMFISTVKCVVEAWEESGGFARWASVRWLCVPYKCS